MKFGKGVFINHSAILSSSGGIEFEDGSMAAPGLRIATINHDMPDYAVVGGVPAKVIRMQDPSEQKEGKDE